MIIAKVREQTEQIFGITDDIAERCVVPPILHRWSAALSDWSSLIWPCRQWKCCVN